MPGHIASQRIMTFAHDCASMDANMLQYTGQLPEHVMEW
jgi:hypothetical protein